MKTTYLPDRPNPNSPAEADIRFLMHVETANMIHSTVPLHQFNKASVHAIVSEFWHVLEGHEKIWRENSSQSSVIFSYLALQSTSQPAQRFNTETYQMQT